MTQSDKIQSINALPCAYRVLDLMADAAVMCLAPPRRGVATGKTLGQIAALFTMSEGGWVTGEEDLPLTLADAVLGLCIIWSHYAADMRDADTARQVASSTGQTTEEVEAVRARCLSRAGTLREIAEHLAGMTGAGQMSEDWQTSRLRCHAVWSRVADRFPGDDPRACAIRETWCREARYLLDA